MSRRLIQATMMKTTKKIQMGFSPQSYAHDLKDKWQLMNG